MVGTGLGVIRQRLVLAEAHFRSSLSRREEHFVCNLFGCLCERRAFLLSCFFFFTVHISVATDVNQMRA